MEVINNKKQFRFEVALPDGDFAELTYRWLKGSMVLMHTFVPVSGRGMGVASLLAQFAMEYAKSNNLTVKIYCPFVKKYVSDHHEYDDIVEK